MVLCESPGMHFYDLELKMNAFRNKSAECRMLLFCLRLNTGSFISSDTVQKHNFTYHVFVHYTSVVKKCLSLFIYYIVCVNDAYLLIYVSVTMLGYPTGKYNKAPLKMEKSIFIHCLY